ncbi:filament-like plant protein 7 [Zingiber officinale]|uniref:filament-like plant protein 7 n=1 Tax=Zingiber officinale TaxID=94328 RepID=UPI001C4D58A8|nr:filament-like plant protein 7 [Zingiber officinale]XP_042374951.1 filament-like plant protein 7 [Zingiber officinale]XP_042374957.1 filament-like plant protein 7 [Zingiber officinale]XP_042374964.1 filament-like plant protein 7 [Zingiber officinale]
MDNKTWVWNKKSSVKNIEKEKILELERYLEDLNEQLSLVRRESNAKDELLAKQTKVSEETVAGWRKTEAETASLKQKLDDVLLQKKSAEERVADRDIALKECMQQLHITKEDQQFLVNNAALKISREQEKVRMLEHKLAETNKRLAELVVENGNLNRILEAKEQIFKEACESNSKVEANLTEVMSRLDSSEKLNASLRYELCMLQKEIEIRNEERDYTNRSSNAAHRQHLENVKKIVKLETECQRLRVMVRKRLPGPTALAKMRSEVQVLDNNNSTEARKKRSSFMSEDFSSKSIVSDDDASSKGAFSLVNRLHAIEDENKILKESLIKKNNELQASRVMFARTTSKLSQVEKQLEEFSKGQVCEPSKGSPLSCDFHVSSISEHGANDEILSCAESWASALVSELEHFKSGKPAASSCRNARISELSLMDDFVEMEKLAIVSLDKHFESSLSVSGDNNSCVTTKDSCAGLDLSEATGKELVPVKDVNTETQLRYTSFKNHPSWLQDILRVIIQKHHIMQKSFSAILNDVRVALDDLNYTIEGDHFDSKSRTQPRRSNLEESVRKLIELVEGIIQKITKSNGMEMSSGDAKANSIAQRSPLANGYVACSFLWENSEQVAVLQNFVSVCNELQCRKVDLEQFAAQVASTLEWIVNHCFSLQDVTDMKATIRKHLDADKLNTSHELKAVVYPSKELDKLDSIEEAHVTDEMHRHYLLSRMDDTETTLKDENEQLKGKITSVESRRKDLESVLKTFTNKNEMLTAQLRESEVNVSNLQLELAALKESKGQIEDQIIKQKFINEDLGTQLSIAKILEVQLKEKSNCCEELEATCLELQLQNESVSSNETPSYALQLEDKQIQTDCDTAEASKKLADCQETMVNLGKQLKALASPQDVPATAKSKHRLQLVDHMREEDQIMLQLPNMKEILSAEALKPPTGVASDDQYLNKGSEKSITDLLQVKSPTSNHIGGTDSEMLMIVPKKQKGRGMFLRKLLLLRREQ